MTSTEQQHEIKKINDEMQETREKQMKKTAKNGEGGS